MVERGDIVLVDLEPVKGSEQGRIRPCLSIKHRLIKKLGSLNESKMIKVNSALKVSLGLD